MEPSLDLVAGVVVEAVVRRIEGIGACRGRVDLGDVEGVADC